MSSLEAKGTATLSVFDRLIDLEPRSRSEPMLTSAQSLRAVKAALRRDLEWLMNTRRIIEEAPESCTELRRSVYSYGLPDMTSLSKLSAADQNLLLKTIELVITCFEPRLTGVRVSLRPLAETAQTLHFIIEGLLRVDPAPEQIIFDTVLELSSGSYQVRGNTGAR